MCHGSKIACIFYQIIFFFSLLHSTEVTNMGISGELLEKKFFFYKRVLDIKKEKSSPINICLLYLGLKFTLNSPLFQYMNS